MKIIPTIEVIFHGTNDADFWNVVAFIASIKNKKADLNLSISYSFTHPTLGVLQIQVFDFFFNIFICN